jgi:hypothetical protein
MTHPEIAETETKFICSIEQNTMILCERHAQVFELAALAAGTPHTVYEMDEEDSEGLKCHACDLQAELTRPRIILPGDLH